jgi:putative membrane protein
MSAIALFSQTRGINGFLGSRASIMLDVVFLAMFLVLPILAWNIWQVKRGRYLMHKRVQLILAAVLLVTVVAFEVDMRWISGWIDRAKLSPYWGSGIVRISLWIHLVFSASTAALWLYVIVGALNNFPKPPAPSDYSRWHKFWGWLAAIDLAMTALTGWVFYYLAFVA